MNDDDGDDIKDGAMRAMPAVIVMAMLILAAVGLKTIIIAMTAMAAAMPMLTVLVMVREGRERLS